MFGFFFRLQRFILFRIKLILGAVVIRLQATSIRIWPTLFKTIGKVMAALIDTKPPRHLPLFSDYPLMRSSN